VARIVTWIAGGSAALLLVYFRFLYPRISQTFQARHSLRTHRKELLAKLTTSLESLKTTQAETNRVLPTPDPYQDSLYGQCHTLDEIVATSEGKRDVPDFALLRCAIADITAQKKQTTTEEVFAILETKLPWLKEEDDGPQRQEKLWETLSTNPLFQHEEVDNVSIWTYTAPPPVPEPPLLQSLHALRSAFPERPAPQTGRFQHTLEALTDLTGFIATGTYSFFRPPTAQFMSSQLSTDEEEVRREIRALKGLVLNRRSFMPTVPRPPSRPGTAPAQDSVRTSTP